VEKNKRMLKVKKDPEQIMTVSIDMGGFEDKRSLLDDLNISDLEEDCLNQPHYIAWWGSVCAGAKREADSAKEFVSFVESRKGLDIRNKVPVKLTIDEINKGVIVSEEYQDAVKRRVRAAYEADMLKIAVEALQHKKDMLVTLAAIKRQEMASGITIGEANEGLKSSVHKKLKKER
jgi:hypothetical protein